MLYIKFILHDEHYLIATRHVREMIPYVKFKQIPHAPAYLAGLINYRGDSLPVIDMSILMYDTPSTIRMGTRIAIVDFNNETHGSTILGLLLENVTETVAFEEAAFRPSGMDVPDSKYLGDIVTEQHLMLQRINIDHILPEEAYPILFGTDGMADVGSGIDDVLPIDP